MATRDVQLAAVLAIGVIPAACVPLPATRRARLRPAVLGALAAASLFVGSVLAESPPLAVVGIFVFAVVASRAAVGRPLGAVALSLCLPLVGVGLSLSSIAVGATLAAVVLGGSVYAFLVSQLWPSRPSSGTPASLASPGAASLRSFGYRAGLAGAICAGTGFALGLEHVGWATGAALLVMRPAPAVQQARSVGRIVDVVLGAALSIGLVTSGAPAGVVAAALGIAVICATATAGSRWYVVPAFTTFIVFVLLLSHAPDQAQERFWERVLETGFGIAVAALVGYWTLPRVRRPSSRRAG
ncbi:FUSC family protein [Aeromicrobium choanae]|uniref:FUSC family protein n=1 Tax=Aeromicrobium choanae TaxID=1736691 RepID=UPI00155FD7D7|nr:FUSC family protein [Aeromicrobium choanae]